MKKIILLTTVLLFLSGCTNYENYADVQKTCQDKEVVFKLPGYYERFYCTDLQSYCLDYCSYFLRGVSKDGADVCIDKCIDRNKS